MFLCVVINFCSQHTPCTTYSYICLYFVPILSWHPKAIAEGSNIKVTDCKDKRKQRFRFSGAAAPITSRDPDLCIWSADPPSQGDRVKLKNCTGDTSQNWSWA